MVLYSVIVIAIGMAAARTTHTVEDYLIAGKGVGLWLLTFGVMGAILSGGAIMGYSGTGYGTGYAGYVNLVSLAFIGLVGSYFVLAKPMRISADKHKVYTLPDYLCVRFGGGSERGVRMVRGLSALAIVLGCSAYMVSQFASIGAVLGPLLNISHLQSILIACAILGVYTVSGGMKASIWTNFFQMSCIVFIGVALNAMILPRVGGLSGLHAELAKIDYNYLRPWHESGSFSMSRILQYGVFVGIFTYAGVPHVSTKFLTTKNVNVLKWAPLVSVILYFLGVISQWPGMAGRVLVEQGVISAPVAPDAILTHMIINLLESPVMAGVFVAAVAAAVMSTAESFLILSSAAIVRDFVKGTLGVKMEEKTELKWIRICCFVVLILGFLLSLKPPTYILLIVTVAWGALSAMFGPVLYLGTRWKRVNTPGAIAGLAVGILVGGILGIMNLTVFSENPILPNFNLAAVGVILGTVSLVVVTLLTKPEKSPLFAHFKSEQ